METFAYRGPDWRTGRFLVRLIVAIASTSGLGVPIRADIPWPEVVRRVAKENELLARRPQGHAGEYFVVCTLYFTPMESGFTAARGFDATPITRPGLSGRKYPRDFLSAVKKEGFGRLREPVNGCTYVRYNRGRAYAFVKHVVGRGSDELVPRFSAAIRGGQRGLSFRVQLETLDPTVKKVFGSTNWQVVDTGGGLRRWQIDLYWGEDEPLGPGHLMARPRGTEFEYAYSAVKTK
jgi:hypothetical protein